MWPAEEADHWRPRLSGRPQYSSTSVKNEKLIDCIHEIIRLSHLVTDTDKFIGLVTTILCSKESRGTLACLYRTSTRFYMLQLISVDSRYFTRPELSLRWSDLHEIKSVSFGIFALE